jgi:hypothetical protein
VGQFSLGLPEGLLLGLGGLFLFGQQRLSADLVGQPGLQQRLARLQYRRIIANRGQDRLGLLQFAVRDQDFDLALLLMLVISVISAHFVSFCRRDRIKNDDLKGGPWPEQHRRCAFPQPVTDTHYSH